MGKITFFYYFSLILGLCQLVLGLWPQNFNFTHHDSLSPRVLFFYGWPTKTSSVLSDEEPIKKRPAPIPKKTKELNSEITSRFYKLENGLKAIYPSLTTVNTDNRLILVQIPDGESGEAKDFLKNIMEIIGDTVFEDKSIRRSLLKFTIMGLPNFRSKYSKVTSNEKNQWQYDPKKAKDIGTHIYRTIFNTENMVFKAQDLLLEKSRIDHHGHKIIYPLAKSYNLESRPLIIANLLNPFQDRSISSQEARPEMQMNRYFFAFTFEFKETHE